MKAFLQFLKGFRQRFQNLNSDDKIQNSKYDFFLNIIENYDENFYQNMSDDVNSILASLFRSMLHLDLCSTSLTNMFSNVVHFKLVEIFKDMIFRFRKIRNEIQSLCFSDHVYSKILNLDSRSGFKIVFPNDLLDEGFEIIKSKSNGSLIKVFVL